MNRLTISVVAVLLLGACNATGAVPSHTARSADSSGSPTLELTARIDPSNNLPTFEYQDDYSFSPTIRVRPGGTLNLTLVNGLPPNHGMKYDVNLHFHGLGVSPKKPADDVLTMLAAPGAYLQYVVKIPATQPPGLYWYHTHVHGETNFQVGEGGMAGPIVVEGAVPGVPQIAKMRERILVVQELGTGAGDVKRAFAANPTPCAAPAGSGLLTVNRRYKPTLRIDPGQQQYFRVLNATGHRFLDLAMDGIPMQIVEIDGYPVGMNPGTPAILTRSHFVLPPAGRVEFIVTGTARSELRTRCFDSGPTGDPDPPSVLAHLRPGPDAKIAAIPPSVGTMRQAPPVPLPSPAASRVVNFGENAAGTVFYINGKAFEPSDPPMFVVRTGTVERWTINNLTSEDHDFHTHQVHFLVQTIDGKPVEHPVWRDSALVPIRTRQPGGGWKPGSITALVDFRSPLIAGTFLFHCHILDHEDRGMMAKIKAI